jgi:hypothetical protein
LEGGDEGRSRRGGRLEIRVEGEGMTSGEAGHPAFIVYGRRVLRV